MVTQKYSPTSISIFYGLSTDTKPTDCNNGSEFHEIDTGKKYRFDEEGVDWVEFSSGSGGGGGGGGSDLDPELVDAITEAYQTNGFGHSKSLVISASIPDESQWGSENNCEISINVPDEVWELAQATGEYVTDCELSTVQTVYPISNARFTSDGGVYIIWQSPSYVEWGDGYFEITGASGFYTLYCDSSAKQNLEGNDCTIYFSAPVAINSEYLPIREDVINNITAATDSSGYGYKRQFNLAEGAELEFNEILNNPGSKRAVLDIDPSILPLLQYETDAMSGEIPKATYECYIEGQYNGTWFHKQALWSDRNGALSATFDIAVTDVGEGTMSVSVYIRRSSLPSSIYIECSDNIAISGLDIYLDITFIRQIPGEFLRISEEMLSSIYNFTFDGNDNATEANGRTAFDIMDDLFAGKNVWISWTRYVDGNYDCDGSTMLIGYKHTDTGDTLFYLAGFDVVLQADPSDGSLLLTYTSESE